MHHHDPLMNVFAAARTSSWQAEGAARRAAWHANQAAAMRRRGVPATDPTLRALIGAFEPPTPPPPPPTRAFDLRTFYRL